MGAPVVVDGDLWGELYLTRHLGRARVRRRRPRLRRDVGCHPRLRRLARGPREPADRARLPGPADRTGEPPPARPGGRDDDPVPGRRGRRRDRRQRAEAGQRPGRSRCRRPAPAVRRATPCSGSALRCPGRWPHAPAGDEFCLLVPTADLAAVDTAVRRFAAEVVGLPHAAGVRCGIASTQGQVGLGPAALRGGRPGHVLREEAAPGRPAPRDGAARLTGTPGPSYLRRR